MFGSRRFGDLKSDLPGISANVLHAALGELEAVVSCAGEASAARFGAGL
jgi:hypothetical protein